MSTAFITGSARRLGSVIALKLADAGYDIALHYRSSAAEANALSELIQKKGRQCKAFQADLLDPAQTSGLMGAVFEAFPDCNLLIHNASLFKRATLLETTPEILESHLAIHVKAPLFLTQDFAKHCQSGQVINILDTRVVRTGVSHFAYLLSKMALHDFTLLAARALAPNIRVNGILPGIALPSNADDERYMKKLSDSLPMRRPATPETVAQTIAMLAASSDLTGQMIYVDGGEHLL